MNITLLKLWRTSGKALSTSTSKCIVGRFPVMFRKEDVAAMRIDYKSPVFYETCLVAKEPFMQFDSWFKEATNVQGVGEVNAMILATCGRDSHPSARVVLLKGYDNSGFTFFTNYNSQKGEDLEENPFASLLFYWHPIHRQVRIEGRVEKISKKESDEYFHSRPRTSQIGAICSPQSSVIPSREVLERRETDLKQQYADEEKSIPKPDHWGGFKVIPDRVEFWQGQSSRLHDRIRFRKIQPDEVVDEQLTKKGTDGWVYERLAP